MGQKIRTSGSVNSQGNEIAAQQNHTMAKFSTICLVYFQLKWELQHFGEDLTRLKAGDRIAMLRAE